MRKTTVLLLLLLAMVLAACATPAAPGAQPTADTAAPTTDAGGDTGDTGGDTGAEFTCEDAIGCVEIPAGDPIKIASALIISGENASLGLDSQNGVELAIEARGQIH